MKREHLIVIGIVATFAVEFIHPHDWPPMAHLPETPPIVYQFPPHTSYTSNASGGTAITVVTPGTIGALR